MFGTSASVRLAAAFVWGGAVVACWPALAQERPAGQPGQGQPAEQGQQPAERPADLPPAEAIFERYVQVIGGWDVLQAVTSRKLEGRLTTRPQRSRAFVTLWQQAPDKFLLRVERPGAETLEIGFDGRIGWRRVGEQVGYVQGDELARMRDAADFHGEANYKARYRSMETVGEVKYRDQPAYAVRTESVSGKVYLNYFEKETGLLRGVHAMVGEEGQELPMLVELTDYRELGGVLYPFKTIRRQQMPDGTVLEETVEYTSGQTNVTDLPQIEAPPATAQPAAGAGQG